jgi:N-acetyl-alpha-D-muramate 1-phosphate uridylyltransferase
MRAMILAAGRGERMRPLTDALPKPLLQAGGRPLIVWLIDALARCGYRELVINVSHLGDRIEAALGEGERWGVRIRYSREREALETAGGIAMALPLLGSAPFLVVNGDLVTGYDFGRLRRPLDPGMRAHLVLVGNPPHHPAGDFGLERGRVTSGEARRHTFSGIGVYDPALFQPIERGAHCQLATLLRPEIAAGRVTGELFEGRWLDSGTSERLAVADRLLRSSERPL